MAPMVTALRSPDKTNPKNLTVCSNAMWQVLFRRHCAKTPGHAYRGEPRSYLFNGRRVWLRSIQPVEPGILCQRWQIGVTDDHGKDLTVHISSGMCNKQRRRTLPA